MRFTKMHFPSTGYVIALSKPLLIAQSGGF
jgi:hypothetical protein